MHIIRSGAVLAVGGLVLAGCGSGDNRTARLEAEVAALKSQVTSTTGPTTTTLAPTTTTTLAPTTTTVKKVVTTTTRPAPTTTTTMKPWCSATAVPASVTRGMTVTALISSNLPNRTIRLMGQAVTTDPGGSVSASMAAPGGQITATMGQILPKTNTVRVDFYAQTPTLTQLIDGPLPPLLASCSAKFISVGP